MSDYDPLTQFPPDTVPKPGPREGEKGIGVGEYLDPIPERGETEPVFHSIVWFPYSAEAEARKFADVNGYALREGVRL